MLQDGERERVEGGWVASGAVERESKPRHLWPSLRNRSIQKVSLRIFSAGTTTAGFIDNNYLLIII